MTKIKCKKCGDILEGDMRGTFKTCKCKSCYIDETPYYCRIGGNREDFEILEDKDNLFKDLKEKENER